jgi:hypothetical protein
MRQPENTSRIPRENLRELLETEAPVTKQRTTARMPAVTLTGLLTLKDEDLPPLPPPRVRPQGTKRLPTLDRQLSPSDVVVTFRQPAPTPWNLDQWPSPFVIALSCAATLLFISLLLRLL